MAGGIEGIPGKKGFGFDKIGSFLKDLVPKNLLGKPDTFQVTRVTIDPTLLRSQLNVKDKAVPTPTNEASFTDGGITEHNPMQYGKTTFNSTSFAYENLSNITAKRYILSSSMLFHRIGAWFNNIRFFGHAPAFAKAANRGAQFPAGHGDAFWRADSPLRGKSEDQDEKPSKGINDKPNIKDPEIKLTKKPTQAYKDQLRTNIENSGINRDAVRIIENSLWKAGKLRLTFYEVEDIVSKVNAAGKQIKDVPVKDVKKMIEDTIKNRKTTDGIIIYPNGTVDDRRGLSPSFRNDPKVSGIITRIDGFVEDSDPGHRG
jgi:hypothetical protein